MKHWKRIIALIVLAVALQLFFSSCVRTPEAEIIDELQDQQLRMSCRYAINKLTDDGYYLYTLSNIKELDKELFKKCKGIYMNHERNPETGKVSKVIFEDILERNEEANMMKSKS